MRGDSENKKGKKIKEVFDKILNLWKLDLFSRNLKEYE